MTNSGWTNGSTRAYRKARAYVLERDRWTCQLCGQAISRNLKFPNPKSATAHHLKGKAHGDNPNDMIAAHLDCNQGAGAPALRATPDPEPTPTTRW